MNQYNNQDVILIAEIGWSHGGDMDLAERMIDSAAWSGAHYAKFQTWSVDRLKPGEWDTDGRRQIYEKAQLSRQNHIELISYCVKKNIKFLSSVFSLPDAELLVELGVRDVKIPSFESRNKELIDYCSKHFDIVFLSTGTSTVEEIGESTKDILNGPAQFYLLHCVSTYPCDYSMANIGKMELLKALSPYVGYSDHIEGIDSAKVAIGFGAQVIEKHFTIDKRLPGRDNKFALEPMQMRLLANYIEDRKKMMIYHGPGYQEVEQNQRDNYTGRFDG